MNKIINNNTPPYCMADTQRSERELCMELWTILLKDDIAYIC